MRKVMSFWYKYLKVIVYNVVSHLMSHANVFVLQLLRFLIIGKNR